MNQRQHINKKGELKPCNAKKRACRFEQHFESLEEGLKYLEENGDLTATLKSSRKNISSNPFDRFQELSKRDRELFLQHLDEIAVAPEVGSQAEEISGKYLKSQDSDCLSSLGSYVGSGYVYINKMLREGKGPSGYLYDKIKDIDKLCEEGERTVLSELPNEVHRYYRGMNYGRD